MNRRERRQPNRQHDRLKLPHDDGSLGWLGSEMKHLEQGVPDLTGQSKPPCFICGGASSGWIVFRNRVERACEKCSAMILANLSQRGIIVVSHVRGNPETVTFHFPNAKSGQQDRETSP